jgi:hypothetical protein
VLASCTDCLPVFSIRVESGCGTGKGVWIGGRCEEQRVPISILKNAIREFAAGRDGGNAVLDARHKRPAPRGHAIDKGSQVEVHHGKVSRYIGGRQTTYVYNLNSGEGALERWSVGTDAQNDNVR